MLSCDIFLQIVEDDRRGRACAEGLQEGKFFTAAPDTYNNSLSCCLMVMHYRPRNRESRYVGCIDKLTKFRLTLTPGTFGSGVKHIAPFVALDSINPSLCRPPTNHGVLTSPGSISTLT